MGELENFCGQLQCSIVFIMRSLKIIVVTIKLYTQKIGQSLSSLNFMAQEGYGQTFNVAQIKMASFSFFVNFLLYLSYISYCTHRAQRTACSGGGSYEVIYWPWTNSHCLYKNCIFCEENMICELNFNLQQIWYLDVSPHHWITSPVSLHTAAQVLINAKIKLFNLDTLC